MITIAVAVYVVVGLAIFFVPALFGEKDPSDWGSLALLWPVAVAIGVPLFAGLGLIEGIHWLFTTLFNRLAKWTEKRKQEKIHQSFELRVQQLDKEAKLAIVDEQFPSLTAQEPIDYRHMNCNLCGQVIDKD